MSNVISIKTIKVGLGVLAVALVLALVGQAMIANAAYTFDRSLKQGMTGDDVMELQKLLNSDADTVVATSGVGSSGSETKYFGSLTKAAVVKFQDKYASEVLTPINLTAGTGYFGTMSRAKANAILAGGTTTTTPGCQTGDLFSRTTGAACVTTTTPVTTPGCQTGDLFSRTTGAACVTTTTPVTTYPAGCTSATGFSTTTGASCATGVVATGEVTVSLAADTPVSGVFVAGQAIGDLAHFSFSNGTGSEVKVTNLVLNRLGVSDDTTMSNIYLFDGNNRLSDSAAVSSGKITFNDPAGLFTVAANSTRTISVKSDIATSTSGQTVGIKLTSYTVSGGSAVTVSLSGNLQSIAAAPANFATVFFNATTNPAVTTVDPQDDYTMWSNTITVNNRDVTLNSLKLRHIGSARTGDMKDFELYVKGVKVGSTVASMSSNGYVFFDLSASPVTITTGSAEIKMIGDLINGSSLTTSWSLQRVGDAPFIESQVNVPILSTVTNTTTAFSARTSTSATINAGTIVFSRATSSPSGTIVTSASSVTMAKFDVKAYGEPMKVESLRFQNNVSGTAYRLRNGAIFLDGSQIGSTEAICGQNTTTASACDSVAGSGASYSEYSFGSSFVVNPGTPRVLEVRADVFDSDATNDATAGTTIQIAIPAHASTSNVQQTSSLGYVSAPSAETSANTLTIGTGTMALSSDQAYGAQSFVAPQTNALVGKFTLTGGSAETTNLTSVDVTLAVAGDFAVTELTNIYLKYGSKTTSIRSTGAASMNFTISDALAASATMPIEIYGDIAAAATDGAGAADTAIASLVVNGTTAQSNTSITSGTALAGQTITAVSSGSLTIALDSSTPLAAEVVASSSPSAGALKVRLTATNEDVYARVLKFRVDANADDVALASAVLSTSGSATGTYTTVGTAQTWNADGSTNPGYISWNLIGNDRIKVPKNGSAYVLVTPTYVSSEQDTTVSGTTPRLVLVDLDADGAAALSASGTGATLINASGIIFQSNASATYVDSTEDTATTALTSTATTLVTANGVVFTTGDTIFIDENADGFWTPATEELMTVVVDSGANLIVERGVYGTTSNAHTVSKNIYRLDNASTTRGVIGNAQLVYSTKPTLSLGSDSPSGASTGGTARVIFTFNVAATNNTVDVAQNIVNLDWVDITITKSASTVTGLVVYPSEFDQNSSYQSTCGGISTTEWRCVLSTTSSANQVIEGASRKYVVRGNVGYSGAGSLEVKIAGLGSANGAGTITAGDIQWDDVRGTATLSSNVGWVDQSPSYIQPTSAMTTTAASGTADTTAPTITDIAITDATADNALTIGATIALTFSEPIDASDIASTLLPGGSAVTVSNAATGDIATVDTTSDLIRITNIIDIDLGNTTAVTAADAAAVTATLSAAGTVLTLTVTEAATLNAADGTETVSAGSGGTTISDLNSVAMTATGSNSATINSIDL